MNIRLLSAEDVKTALPMPIAIDAMETGFKQFSAGETTVPLRSQLKTEKGVSLIMPAYIPSTKDMAIKVVSVFNENPQVGLPNISASVLVLNPETGFPMAFLDGTSLTAIRTGAAGGLSCKLLSRAESKTLAVFGAGVQARSQVSAVLAVRSIRKIRILDPITKVAEKMAADIKLNAKNIEVEVAINPKKAVQDADIIVAATNSMTPVFNGNVLKPGTHIVGIGSFTPQMQEIDEVTVEKASIFVDSREACLAEAGDLIISGASIDAEIGDVINGVHPGRKDENEITLFKSVGIAVQDTIAAAAVIKQASKNNIGKTFNMLGPTEIKP